MTEEARDIGWARAKLSEGYQVRRSGWNGKGMFIVLSPATEKAEPYISMWTAAQKWQPGWVCSQADFFACDWELAE